MVVMKTRQTNKESKVVPQDVETSVGDIDNNGVLSSPQSNRNRKDNSSPLNLQSLPGTSGRMKSTARKSVYTLQQKQVKQFLKGVKSLNLQVKSNEITDNFTESPNENEKYSTPDQPSCTRVTRSKHGTIPQCSVVDLPDSYEKQLRNRLSLSANESSAIESLKDIIQEYDHVEDKKLVEDESKQSDGTFDSCEKSNKTKSVPSNQIEVALKNLKVKLTKTKCNDDSDSITGRSFSPFDECTHVNLYSGHTITSTVSHDELAITSTNKKAVVSELDNVWFDSRRPSTRSSTISHLHSDKSSLYDECPLSQLNDSVMENVVIIDDESDGECTEVNNHKDVQLLRLKRHSVKEKCPKTPDKLKRLQCSPRSKEFYKNFVFGIKSSPKENEKKNCACCGGPLISKAPYAVTEASSTTKDDDVVELVCCDSPIKSLSDCQFAEYKDCQSAEYKCGKSISSCSTPSASLGSATTLSFEQTNSHSKHTESDSACPESEVRIYASVKDLMKSLQDEVSTSPKVPIICLPPVSENSIKNINLSNVSDKEKDRKTSTCNFKETGLNSFEDNLKTFKSQKSPRKLFQKDTGKTDDIKNCSANIVESKSPKQVNTSKIEKNSAVSSENIIYKAFLQIDESDSNASNASTNKEGSKKRRCKGVRMRLTRTSWVHTLLDDKSDSDGKDKIPSPLSNVKEIYETDSVTECGKSTLPVSVSAKNSIDEQIEKLNNIYDNDEDDDYDDNDNDGGGGVKNEAVNSIVQLSVAGCSNELIDLGNNAETVNLQRSLPTFFNEESTCSYKLKDKAEVNYKGSWTYNTDVTTVNPVNPGSNNVVKSSSFTNKATNTIGQHKVSPCCDDNKANHSSQKISYSYGLPAEEIVSFHPVSKIQTASLLQGNLRNVFGDENDCWSDVMSEKSLAEFDCHLSKGHDKKLMTCSVDDILQGKKLHNVIETPMVTLDNLTKDTPLNSLIKKLETRIPIGRVVGCSSIEDLEKESEDSLIDSVDESSDSSSDNDDELEDDGEYNGTSNSSVSDEEEFDEMRECEDDKEMSPSKDNSVEAYPKAEEGDQQILSPNETTSSGQAKNPSADSEENQFDNFLRIDGEETEPCCEELVQKNGEHNVLSAKSNVNKKVCSKWCFNCKARNDFVNMRTPHMGNGIKMEPSVEEMENHVGTFTVFEREQNHGWQCKSCGGFVDDFVDISYLKNDGTKTTTNLTISDTNKTGSVLRNTFNMSCESDGKSTIKVFPEDVQGKSHEVANGNPNKLLKNTKENSVDIKYDDAHIFKRFEKSVHPPGSKTVFVSTDLDSYLEVSSLLKTDLAQTNIKSTDPPCKFSIGNDVFISTNKIKPDVDLVDDIMFLSFASEDVLTAHVNVERNKDVCGHERDVSTNFNLHLLRKKKRKILETANNKAVKKSDVLFKKRMRKYEKNLIQELERFMKIKNRKLGIRNIDASRRPDILKLKGWRSKIIDSNVLGKTVKVYQTHEKQPSKKIMERKRNRIYPPFKYLNTVYDDVSSSSTVVKEEPVTLTCHSGQTRWLFDFLKNGVKVEHDNRPILPEHIPDPNHMDDDDFVDEMNSVSDILISPTNSSHPFASTSNQVEFTAPGTSLSSLDEKHQKQLPGVLSFKEKLESARSKIHKTLSQDEALVEKNSPTADYLAKVFPNLWHEDKMEMVVLSDRMVTSALKTLELPSGLGRISSKLQDLPKVIRTRDLNFETEIYSEEHSSPCPSPPALVLQKCFEIPRRKCRKIDCPDGCDCETSDDSKLSDCGPPPILQKSNCEKDFCRLGCVCDSLLASNTKTFGSSCQKSECRFRCKCGVSDVFNPDFERSYESDDRIKDTKHMQPSSSMHRSAKTDEEDYQKFLRCHRRAQGVEEDLENTRYSGLKRERRLTSKKRDLMFYDALVRYEIQHASWKKKKPAVLKLPLSPPSQISMDKEVSVSMATVYKSPQKYLKRKLIIPCVETEEEDLNDPASLRCARVRCHTRKQRDFPLQCTCRNHETPGECTKHEHSPALFVSKKDIVEDVDPSVESIKNSEQVPVAHDENDENSTDLNHGNFEIDKKKEYLPPGFSRQMMLLQPKQRQCVGQTVVASEPHLLEILSNCQWEKIRSHILSYVAQQVRGRDYPPTAKICYLDFLIDVLAKSPKPTKIPNHLRSTLPKVMYAIRLLVRMVNSASDKIGYSALRIKSDVTSRPITSTSESDIQCKDFKNSPQFNGSEHSNIRESSNSPTKSENCAMKSLESKVDFDQSKSSVQIVQYESKSKFEGDRKTNNQEQDANANVATSNKKEENLDKIHIQNSINLLKELCDSKESDSLKPHIPSEVVSLTGDNESMVNDQITSQKPTKHSTSSLPQPRCSMSTLMSNKSSIVKLIPNLINDTASKTLCTDKVTSDRESTSNIPVTLLGLSSKVASEMPLANTVVTCMSSQNNAVSYTTGKSQTATAMFSNASNVLLHTPGKKPVPCFLTCVPGNPTSLVNNQVNMILQKPVVALQPHAMDKAACSKEGDASHCFVKAVRMPASQQIKLNVLPNTITTLNRPMITSTRLIPVQTVSSNGAHIIRNGLLAPLTEGQCSVTSNHTSTSNLAKGTVDSQRIKTVPFISLSMRVQLQLNSQMKAYLPRGTRLSSLLALVKVDSPHSQLDPSQFTVDMVKGLALVHQSVGNDVESSDKIFSNLPLWSEETGNDVTTHVRIKGGQIIRQLSAKETYTKTVAASSLITARSSLSCALSQLAADTINNCQIQPVDTSMEEGDHQWTKSISPVEALVTTTIGSQLASPATPTKSLKSKRKEKLAVRCFETDDDDLGSKVGSDMPADMHTNLLVEQSMEKIFLKDTYVQVISHSSEDHEIDVEEVELFDPCEEPLAKKLQTAVKLAKKSAVDNAIGSCSLHKVIHRIQKKRRPWAKPDAALINEDAGDSDSRNIDYESKSDPFVYTNGKEDTEVKETLTQPPIKKQRLADSQTPSVSPWLCVVSDDENSDEVDVCNTSDSYDTSANQLSSGSGKMSILKVCLQEPLGKAQMFHMKGIHNENDIGELVIEVYRKCCATSALNMWERQRRKSIANEFSHLSGLLQLRRTQMIKHVILDEAVKMLRHLQRQQLVLHKRMKQMKFMTINLVDNCRKLSGVKPLLRTKFGSFDKLFKHSLSLSSVILNKPLLQLRSDAFKAKRNDSVEEIPEEDPAAMIQVDDCNKRYSDSQLPEQCYKRRRLHSILKSEVMSGGDCLEIQASPMPLTNVSCFPFKTEEFKEESGDPQMAIEEENESNDLSSATGYEFDLKMSSSLVSEQNENSVIDTNVNISSKVTCSVTSSCASGGVTNTASQLSITVPHVVLNSKHLDALKHGEPDSMKSVLNALADKLDIPLDSSFSEEQSTSADENLGEKKLKYGNYPCHIEEGQKTFSDANDITLETSNYSDISDDDQSSTVVATLGKNDNLICEPNEDSSKEDTVVTIPSTLPASTFEGDVSNKNINQNKCYQNLTKKTVKIGDVISNPQQAKCDSNIDLPSDNLLEETSEVAICPLQSLSQVPGTSNHNVSFQRQSMKGLSTGNILVSERQAPVPLLLQTSLSDPQKFVLKPNPAASGSYVSATPKQTSVRQIVSPTTSQISLRPYNPRIPVTTNQISLIPIKPGILAKSVSMPFNRSIMCQKLPQLAQNNPTNSVILPTPMEVKLINLAGSAEATSAILSDDPLEVVNCPASRIKSDSKLFNKEDISLLPNTAASEKSVSMPLNRPIVCQKLPQLAQNNQTITTNSVLLPTPRKVKLVNPATAAEATYASLSDDCMLKCDTNLPSKEEVSLPSNTTANENIPIKRWTIINQAPGIATVIADNSAIQIKLKHDTNPSEPLTRKNVQTIVNVAKNFMLCKNTTTPANSAKSSEDKSVVAVIRQNTNLSSCTAVQETSGAESSEIKNVVGSKEVTSSSLLSKILKPQIVISDSIDINSPHSKDIAGQNPSNVIDKKQSMAMNLAEWNKFIKKL